MNIIFDNFIVLVHLRDYIYTIFLINFLYHHPIKEKAFLLYLNLILYTAVKGTILWALTVSEYVVTNMVPVCLYFD